MRDAIMRRERVRGGARGCTPLLCTRGGRGECMGDRPCRRGWGCNGWVRMGSRCTMGDLGLLSDCGEIHALAQTDAHAGAARAPSACHEQQG